MNRLNIITIAVAVLLVAGAYSAAYVGFLGSPTKTVTSTVYTSSFCTVGAPAIGVAVHVVTDSGSPVVGAVLSGQSFLLCNGQPLVSDLGPTSTNSSGWASVLHDDPGTYYLTMTYHGNSYAFAIQTQPISITYVIFHIPSGNLTSCFSYSKLDCLPK